MSIGVKPTIFRRLSRDALGANSRSYSSQSPRLTAAATRSPTRTHAVSSLTFGVWADAGAEEISRPPKGRRACVRSSSNRACTASSSAIAASMSSTSNQICSWSRPSSSMPFRLEKFVVRRSRAFVGIATLTRKTARRSPRTAMPTWRNRMASVSRCAWSLVPSRRRDVDPHKADDLPANLEWTPRVEYSRSNSSQALRLIAATTRSLARTAGL